MKQQYTFFRTSRQLDVPGRGMAVPGEQLRELVIITMSAYSIGDVWYLREV
jgi:hypothetical protein